MLGKDANRPQVKHYQAAGIEPIDVIRAKGRAFFEAFCLGNMEKYLGRCQFSGKMREDLVKIQNYAQFLIDEIDGKNTSSAEQLEQEVRRQSTQP